MKKTDNTSGMRFKFFSNYILRDLLFSKFRALLQPRKIKSITGQFNPKNENIFITDHLNFWACQKQTQATKKPLLISSKYSETRL